MVTDSLVPAYDSSERKSNIISATFNLSATIIGGGVLSLPLAYEKCGITLASALMVVAAIVTERTLYLLCLCSRITGATSYGEVGKVAFGTWMESTISFILFIFLMFVLVAYMVLVRDIWTSIIQMILLFFFQQQQQQQQQQQHLNADIDGDWVLFFILIAMSPFLVQSTLHSLRYNCYIGFASVSILCIALCHHAIVGDSSSSSSSSSNNSSSTVTTTNRSSPPSSFGDILFAFPIITLSFLSIFNVLPVQNSLIEPSRERIRLVITGAIGSSFVVTVLFGLSGYLYAGDDTDGNILNNIPSSIGGGGGRRRRGGDWLFFLGRLGCGTTIMLALAMMLLPCRESLLEVLDVAVHGPHDVVPIPVTTGEEIPLVSKATTASDERLQKNKRLKDNVLVHYLSTFVIAYSCYFVAIHVPGVAVVWSLCGSFLAFLIGFIFPSACYIQIQKRNNEEQHCNNNSVAWIWFSWTLLVTSTMAAIACTAQTIIRLLAEEEK